MSNIGPSVIHHWNMVSSTTKQNEKKTTTVNTTTYPYYPATTSKRYNKSTVIAKRGEWTIFFFNLFIIKYWKDSMASFVDILLKGSLHRKSRSFFQSLVFFFFVVVSIVVVVSAAANIICNGSLMRKYLPQNVISSSCWLHRIPHLVISRTINGNHMSEYVVIS